MTGCLDQVCTAIVTGIGSPYDSVDPDNVTSEDKLVLLMANDIG